MDHGRGRRQTPDMVQFPHHAAFHPPPPPHLRPVPPQAPPHWSYYAALQHPMPRPQEQQFPSAPLNAPYLPTPYPATPASIVPHMPPSGFGVAPNLRSPQGGDADVQSHQSSHRTLPFQSHGAPVTPPSAPAPADRPIYLPPLPWYSVPLSEFPRRIRRKRRRKPMIPSQTASIELPSQFASAANVSGSSDLGTKEEASSLDRNVTGLDDSLESIHSLTPTASQSPSETDSTQPTTPSSALRPRATQVTPSTRQAGKIVPAVPIVPSTGRPRRPLSHHDSTAESRDTDERKSTAATISSSGTNPSSEHVNKASADTSSHATNQPPKSWADLVRSNAPNADAVNGQQVLLSANGAADGTALKGASLSEVLARYVVPFGNGEKHFSPIRPRGLVNTGNMCYMNSVLQVLMFCAPFHKLLGQISSFTAHSFTSNTPMIDGMVHFYRELSVGGSPISTRARQRQTTSEEYGEPFTPDFLYEVVRSLPRFSTMRRGHQQDAEEFLGFLLEELHEECLRAMEHPKLDSSNPDAGKLGGTDLHLIRPEDHGWLEVGPKQRPAVTRSSGFEGKDSPITSIFGGKLRSELRVPGAKNSITLQSCQSVQLDIGSSQVENITDALKGLTRSEILHGEFATPNGSGISATKQVFIETLPPVLILHLKRFQYDNAGGTQKIWKTVGYPLDLNLPKEIFPPHKRARLTMLPAKYRLTGVIYHHGKSASGGHYTVDVRGQDDRSWIRLDDTSIARVRSDEVAGYDPAHGKGSTSLAFEQNSLDSSTGKSVRGKSTTVAAEGPQAEKGWSRVNGATSQPPPAPPQVIAGPDGSETPGSSTGSRTPLGRSSAREGKVAYLLFYEKVENASQRAT